MENYCTKHISGVNFIFKKCHLMFGHILFKTKDIPYTSSPTKRGNFQVPLIQGKLQDIRKKLSICRLQLFNYQPSVCLAGKIATSNWGPFPKQKKSLGNDSVHTGVPGVQFRTPKFETQAHILLGNQKALCCIICLHCPARSPHFCKDDSGCTL